MLASPARASHILQLYDSEHFLVAAVAYFAAEGLSRGQAVLLTGTKEHLARTRQRLEAVGIDADAAVRSGQLLPADVHESLSAAEGCAALEGALADPRFTGARWWGELTNTLHYRGEREAGLAAERLADATARKYGATVFCSFLCDRYDARGYDDVLKDLCRVHSHVVPAEDYVRHRMAVNRAIAEVVGDIKGTLLQSLASWRGLGCELPSSQAMLFWVREALPEHFEAVLARARKYHAGDESFS